MKKKFLLSENGQRTVSALCILAAYIIVYGSFALFEYVLTKKALVAFVYIAAGTFFTYQPCRNKLTYSLAKSLPRPLDIAVSVFIAAAAGVFAAPYYMGERLIPFECTKEALTAMPLKKLKKLDLDLTLIGLQFMPERKKSRFGFMLTAAKHTERQPSCINWSQRYIVTDSMKNTTEKISNHFFRTERFA